MDHPLEQASQLRIVELERVRVESPTIKSLVFQDALCETAYPGQFIMVWVPGVDEIPMSLTHEFDSRRSMLLVKLVGDATRELHKLQRGDKIGVRGPYGNQFTWNPKKENLVVAGGTGITPLLDIALTSDSGNVEFLYGAKEKAELILLEEIERRVKNLLIITEDGDYGEKGQLSDIVERRLKVKRYDSILSCGPELMIRRIFEIAKAHNISGQASLERIMKCGIGICGSCTIDGFRVCKDGPIFSSNHLRDVKELGLTTRDHSGRKIPVLK